MKALLCLTFLALTSFIHTADLVNSVSDSFLIGDWYSVNFDYKTINPKNACCPYGKITMKASGQSVVVSSTGWAGYFCYNLGLNNNKNTLNYNLKPTTTYSTLAGTKNLYSQPDAVQFTVRDLQVNNIHEDNSTQKVTFELTLNTAFSKGEKCSVVLSKANTEVTTVEAAQQAALSTKKVSAAEDLSDLDDFALFEDIFKELAEKYSIQSKFLSNDE